jgi:hypothetical protein
MTVSVKHNLEFVTEFDETNPIAKRMLSLSNSEQVEILEGMLKNLVAPHIQPLLDEINENGTYAILKVAD